jgi:DNA-binding Lrp family transcriptional regulator
MDSLDQELLFLLGQNARATVSDLAGQLGVSRATVQNRIERLQRDQVIARFTVELGDAADSNGVEAVVLLRLKSGDSRKTVARLSAMSEVIRLTSANGDYDFIAELRAASLPKLDQVLMDIRMLPQISDSNSIIRMKQFK